MEKEKNNSMDPKVHGALFLSLMLLSTTTGVLVVQNIAANSESSDREAAVVLLCFPAHDLLILPMMVNDWSRLQPSGSDVRSHCPPESLSPHGSKE